MNILGPCCCDCQCTNSVVTRYDNTTTVPDYITDGDVRAPYPRPSNNIACTDLCGSVDEPPCGPWDGDLPTCETGVERDHNCYTATEETVEVNCCETIGWKAVQAVKTWHGRWGFGHADSCTEILGEPGDGECEGCVYNGPQLSPPDTKYRTVSRTLLWHKEIDLDGTVQNNDITVNLSATVNRYSGVKSYGSCSSIYTVDGAEQADWQTGGGDPQVLWLLTQLEVDCHGVFTVQYSGILTANLNIYLEAINQVSRGETPTGPYPWDTLDVDWSETGCTIHGIRYFTPTDFEDWTLTVEFTDAYTSAAVVQDVKDMLGRWNLSDKCQYPWRTDDLCGLVPIVRYDEFVTPQNPDPVGQICPDNEPPTPDAYPTGELYGAPNPIGYDRHFQFRHENYVWLPDSSVWCLESYGYESPPELPATTTEWTTALEAALTRRGGWMEFNTQGRLYAQKSADAILEWPSMNFARPCGADASTIDPDTVDCDTNPDGDLRWPDAPAECSGIWNTDAPRRNYVLKEWTFNLRAVGESQRLHDNWELCYGAQCFEEPTIITETVTGMTCTDWGYPQLGVGCVYVACITPNSEAWEHGRNHDWTESFVCDEKYGSKWMAVVQQAMIDPLWKRPVLPCPDGTPDPDAEPPYVEARCELPAGAPALPEGISITCSIAACPPSQAEDCDFDFLHWNADLVIPPP